MDEASIRSTGTIPADRAGYGCGPTGGAPFPVAVESLRPCGARQSVIVGSIGHGEREAPRISKEAAKARLLEVLWSRYRSSDPGEAWLAPTSHGSYPQLDASSNPTRKPLLSVGGRRGPSISFTHLAGRTWAAMSAGASCVGIDAACHEEFMPPYPVDKIFHREEFEYGSVVTGGNREETAAFLWSCKEAVIKAMGCGLSMLEPLHLSVGPWSESGALGDCRVDPRGPALNRFPLLGISPVPVTALRDEGFWLSIAVVRPLQTLRRASS